MKKRNGFTLIELMVAILIFSIISTMSYRIILILVKTKEVVTSNQQKWSSLSRFMNRVNEAWINKMPIPVYDTNGKIMPDVYGRETINEKYDSQLEITIAGSIGDNVNKSTPPKRVGFRFINNKIFYVIWNVLNRVQSTQPEIYLILDNVKNFNIEYLYTDQQWRAFWPANGGNLYSSPVAIKMTIELENGEIITREWA